MKYLLSALLLFCSTVAPALSCSDLHAKPVNVIAPADASLAWPWKVYYSNDYWFNVVFSLQNTSGKRTAAVKMQANLVDAFSTVLETWPIVESAKLSSGDIDHATWAVRCSDPVTAGIDHVDLYVLAIKYDDGSTWQTSNPAPPIGPMPPADSHFMRAL